MGCKPATRHGKNAGDRRVDAAAGEKGEVARGSWGRRERAEPGGEGPEEGDWGGTWRVSRGTWACALPCRVGRRRGRRKIPGPAVGLRHRAGSWQAAEARAAAAAAT